MTSTCSVVSLEGGSHDTTTQDRIRAVVIRLEAERLSQRNNGVLILAVLVVGKTQVVVRLLEARVKASGLQGSRHGRFILLELLLGIAHLVVNPRAVDG